jgi:arabinogalactan endo-1,4-beta-galactosidase
MRFAFADCPRAAAYVPFAFALSVACSSNENSGPTTASGGAPGSGAAASGSAGTPTGTGGIGQGGSPVGQAGSTASGSGGVSANGGQGGANGGSGDIAGANTAGLPGSGGRANTGGVSGGGALGGEAGDGGGKPGTGGKGSTTGGTAAGGTAAGGSAGAAGAGGQQGSFKASFYIGADISDQETAPEATRANLLTLMKSHGFNYIRLRTFVDPKAADGYDRTNGYDDIAHTVAFGKQIKDAGMGLLVNFHYSDNWADPGKQCVPIAWQNHATIAELASALHDYTKDAITKLIAGGARPDMVQIGNETTPGMLLHRCDSGGQPTGNNPITGSTSNWANLGALLKAGVDAVREVDPGILVSFHIDRGGDKATDTKGAALQLSVDWLTNAMKYATPDAFGESCYQRYQGDPNSTANTKASWTSTFAGLATKFPNVKLFAAEYGPMEREINDVVFGLANQQGIGTFNWEPTTQGDWNTGHDLLRRSGANYTAQPDLALYDQMKIDYASRL